MAEEIKTYRVAVKHEIIEKAQAFLKVYAANPDQAKQAAKLLFRDWYKDTCQITEIGPIEEIEI